MRQFSFSFQNVSSASINFAVLSQNSHLMSWQIVNSFGKIYTPEMQRAYSLGIMYFSWDFWCKATSKHSNYEVGSFLLLFSVRIDSCYVTSSQFLRKGFSQKLGITCKCGNTIYKLNLRYRLYSVKVNISFPNFWKKT